MTNPSNNIAQFKSPTFKSTNSRVLTNNSENFVKLIMEGEDSDKLIKFLSNYELDLEYRYPISDGSSRSLFYMAAIYAKSSELVYLLVKNGARISQNAINKLTQKLNEKLFHSDENFDLSYAEDILYIVQNLPQDVALQASPRLGDSFNSFPVVSVNSDQEPYASIVNQIITSSSIDFKHFNFNVKVETFNRELLNELMEKSLQHLGLQQDNHMLNMLEAKIDKISPGDNLLLYSIKSTLAKFIKYKILISDSTQDDNADISKLFNVLEAISVSTLKDTLNNPYQSYQHLVKTTKIPNSPSLFNHEILNFYQAHPQYKTCGMFLAHTTKDQLKKFVKEGYYGELKKFLYMTNLDLDTREKLVEVLYDHKTQKFISNLHSNSDKVPLGYENAEPFVTDLVGIQSD